MKNKSLKCVLALLILSTSAFANQRQAFKGWKQAETTHFKFIYEPAAENTAQAYAKIADEAWNNVSKIYSFPQEKTTVYIISRTNVVNAYTYFAPPHMVMFDSPEISSLFGFRDDWAKLFFTHELIHVANVSFEDKDYLLAKIFGEFFRNIDYAGVNGWALEGLTTVLETEITNGGRGRSPYFELEFKGPTLDNALLPYSQIGSEIEPPHSQIYVCGYLIMRAIADKHGIQALADLERNRRDGLTWEDSVLKVTGQTAADIYREVKIALEKKYADERKIPEGKIISPNNMNTYYSQPAIVLSDGSIIATRTSLNNDKAVVLLNPKNDRGQTFVEDTLYSDKIVSNYKETILFTGDFSDTPCVTADENQTVYVSMGITRNNRNPGTETQFALYKWTRFSGLTKLTKDSSSYFQPAVSPDGSTLVAVEQNGLKMRIVKIDTSTGDKTVLFQDDKYHFVQPALNHNGNQITFLLLKEDRACVAIGDTSTGEYSIIHNDSPDFIVDPSAPCFNSDGTLTFVSNDRGRLEAYSAILDNQTNTYQVNPMLSDPIGITWAYKSNFGIIYTSMASTGTVIKIKPRREWGNPADFEGPSPAGEIMTFGKYIDDYPEFRPFSATYGKTNSSSENTNDSTQDTESNKQPADTTKNYRTRSDDALNRLNNLPPVTTELTNERTFIPGIVPLLYMPFINAVTDPFDDEYLGIGGIFVGQTPKVQMKQGILVADLFYYPKLKNITGNFISEIPFGTSLIDLFLSRSLLTTESISGENLFTETDVVTFGLTLPIISYTEHRNATNLNYLAYAGAIFTAAEEHAFNITDKVEYNSTLEFQTGFDFAKNIKTNRDRTIGFDITALALGNYNFNKNNLFAGFEGEVVVDFGTQHSKQEFDIVTRYTDFPAETNITFSRAHLASTTENCLYPGKLLLQYSLISPNFLNTQMDGSLFAQTLISFGKNTVDAITPDSGLPLNITTSNILNLGAELALPIGNKQKLSFGGNILLDFANPEAEPKYKFFFGCKFNWIRI